MVGEQDADLVAGEGPPPAGAGHRDAEAIGIGVVGEDHVGAELAGQVEREVEGAGLLGVGEGDRREVGVGLGLGGHDGRGREPAAVEGSEDDIAADPVHRRVDDLDGPGVAVEPAALDHRQVGLDDSVVEAFDECVGRRGQRDRALRRRGDVLGDDRVVGRDDLGAVAQVDLVAVVGGRVVARGDHDAAVGAEVTHREGEHRRGQRPRQHDRATARGGEHARRVLGEAQRLVPGVVADHDGRPPPEVRGESRGGLLDHHPVHAVGPGPDRTPQPRGAELEPAAEAIGQLVVGTLAQQGAQLLPGRLVGVGRDPRVDLEAQLVRDVRALVHVPPI